MTIMLTSRGTEGRPVSMWKCAASRYKGSCCAYSSRSLASGSGTCSSGRCVSWRSRRYSSSGLERRYTTRPASRRRCRFASRSTAPPPVATTAVGPAASSASTCSSTARKASSPSRAKYSRMLQPRRCSIRWSESKKGSASRLASWRPTVDLPLPGMPTRDRINCGGPPASAHAAGEAVAHHLRGDEDQHLLLAAGAAAVLEKVARHRDVAEQGHAGLVLGFGQLEDAADHHGAAVLHQHLGLDVLGVDGD